MQANSNKTGKTKFSHLGLYNSLLEDKIQSIFPNVEIALCILLTAWQNVKHSKNNVLGQT